MSNEGEVQDLLDERPDLRDALREIARVDATHDTWSFDDVSVDSGKFGELISREVVESAGDEYRLADPEAVDRTLGGGPVEEGPRAPGSVDGQPRQSLSDWTQSTDFLAPSSRALLGALVFVVLVRSIPVEGVYRGSNIVLSGNDAYFYRFLVEQLVFSGQTPLSLQSLASLSSGALRGEPLLVATLWLFADVAGGTVRSVGHVLAWYPVGVAGVTAVFVYSLAVETTGDRRIGLASVVMFAVLPAHAFRTGLGFADHHAFDYLWLTLSGLVMLQLATVGDRDDWSSHNWALAVVLGLSIAGQTLAWEAGPLLVGATAVAIVVKAVLDVAADRSPLPASLPALAGFALGAGVVVATHSILGWQSLRVAIAPVVIVAGVVSLVLTAEAIHRTTGESRHLGLAFVTVTAAVVLTFRTALPGLWNRLISGIDFLFIDANIAETVGLFSNSSLASILLLGFSLLIALPVLVSLQVAHRTDVKWQMMSVYTLYFLVLSIIQVRFAGELAAFLSVFTGAGFCWLGDWVDIIRPVSLSEGDAVPLTIPNNRQTILSLVVLFALIGGPGLAQSAIKHDQVRIDDERYETATVISNHSSSLGQQYPENYVLSRWSQNRVFNYYVNGQSKGYNYARNTYPKFIRGENPSNAYAEFRGRVGYVVIDRQVLPPDNGTVGQLTEAYGSRTERNSGVRHYRAIHVSDTGRYVVYQLVPGAVIAGEARHNATVTLVSRHNVSGVSFRYERVTRAHQAQQGQLRGNYAVGVAYPGEYVIQTDNSTTRVVVPERAIRNGTRITVSG